MPKEKSKYHLKPKTKRESRWGYKKWLRQRRFIRRAIAP